MSESRTPNLFKSIIQVTVPRYYSGQNFLVKVVFKIHGEIGHN